MDPSRSRPIPVSALEKVTASSMSRAAKRRITFLTSAGQDQPNSSTISYLRPFDELEAEQARSASLDVGREFGDLELNGALFGSRVEDALAVRLAGDSLVLFNAEEPTRTWGTELLARWHREPFHLTATHTYLRSTEIDPERR